MKVLFLSIGLLVSTLVFSQEKINWMTIEAAEKACKLEPRKLVVDVYTDWCGWCKTMDRTTFKDSSVVSIINTHYYAVKLNAEQRDSIVFQGTTYKFVPKGSRGYHELAAAMLNGKMSYPSIVFFNEDLKLLGIVPGYLRALEFTRWASFVELGIYKTKSFQEYVESLQASQAKD